MRTLYIMLLLVICSTLGLHAQAKVDREEIIVTGLITDESHEPLVGVNVVIQDRPGLGAITDINGKFKIKMEPYLRLVISFIGFETQEILIKEQKTIKVVMKEAKATALDEVVVTGTGEQRKLTMTGAVTNVDVSTLKTSSSSITNALAGNVAGVLARQASGMPGENRSEFWIRGISTFGAGSSALVLVDGFERSMNEINIEDIETFTVLKDASATAIYGSRGANGVVLITTKRGKEGKVHIDAKVETTYNTRTYTPELVDGYTYATLMNEARITRNQIPFYSDEDLHLLANGLDKDLFPNVDWMGMLLKKGAPTYRATLNINGGGSLARYYVSASYVKEAGMEMSDFLKAQGMSEEDYEEDCQQYAESKVEQNLIVQGIMDAEGLSLDDDDIQTLKDELLSEYGYESFDQLVAYYGEQEVNESLALMRVERFIVDNATVNETSATEADVANEDADPESEDTGVDAVEDTTEDNASEEDSSDTAEESEETASEDDVANEG